MEINTQQYLDRLEVIHPTTMFQEQNDFKYLQKCLLEKVCPHCNHRIYEDLKGNYRCKSPSICTGYFIRKKKYIEFISYKKK